MIGGSAALAQTTTAPNSGAGVPGSPGNKSGPAVKPGEHNPTVSGQDQSKVPGLPGNKSGLRRKNHQRTSKASDAIPIVFETGGDPVKAGLVASLNRPDEKVTGGSWIASALSIVPKVSIIGLLVNPD